MLQSEVITGMKLEYTRHGFILVTCYCLTYDATSEVPKSIQTSERQRLTTASDLIELTKLGYFSPAENKEL